MGLFRKTEGQEAADAMLSASLDAGRLAHAYLFAGPPGTGRLTAALELAASWMCRSREHGYCGECRDCLRVFGFSHPDVRITAPVQGKTPQEGLAEIFSRRISDGITPLTMGGTSTITIDSIRELGHRLSMKAYENKGHVEIITEADRMGPEAANALLKTLEEPPAETIIILITSSLSALLPTIRSRAHLIRFRRLPAAAVASILGRRIGLGAAEAMEIALASDGSPGAALLSCSDGKEDKVEKPAAILKSVAGCSRASQVMSISQAFFRGLSREAALAKAMVMVRGLSGCVHDVRRISLGLPPLAQLPGALEKLDDLRDAAEASGDIFCAAEENLRRNGSVHIVMASAFLSFWRVARHRPDGRTSVS
jgi:DNA polymerase III subunit delta'